jgi:hypothetical protein
MKTLLLFPPPGDPTRPCLTLAALTAYLRQAQIGAVEQRDLALEAYLYWFNPRRMGEAARRAAARVEELERGPELPPERAAEYVQAAEAALAAPFLAARIDEVLATLRDPEAFFDLAKFQLATKLFRRACDVISGVHHPASLQYLEYFNYAPAGGPVRSFARLEAALADREHDPFARFFQEEVIPGIASSPAELIGISVTFPAQLVPALALARMIRRASPASHLCLGGSMINYFWERPWRLARFLDWVDSLVPFAGERPLVDLARCLERGEDPSRVPGLVTRGPAGEARMRAPPEAIRIGELPAPDYGGLLLRSYLAPRPVLSLALTKGCYWGECGFCTRLDRYEQRRLEQILADIDALRARHGPCALVFAGDVVPARLMHKVAEALAATYGEPPLWSCDTRFDPSFTDERCARLHAGGCRALTIGLESGSERVLRQMRKGIDLQVAEGNLAAFARAKIGVRVGCFLGFPTETRPEAEQTLEFIRRSAANLYSATCGRFILEERSACCAEPHLFGVASIDRIEGEELALDFAFRSASGMSAAQTDAVWREVDRELRKLFPHRLTALSGAHVILQIDRHGVKPPSMEAERPSAPEVPQGSEGQRLRLSDDVTLRRLRWDIDARGGMEPGALPEADGKLFVFDGRTGRVSSAARGARAILEACQSGSTIPSLLDEFPAAARERLRDFVHRLVASGWIRLCDPPAARPTWSLLPVFLIRSAGFPFQWLSGLRMPESASGGAEVVRLRGRVEELQRALPRRDAAEARSERLWPDLARCARRRERCPRELADRASSESPALARWVADWNGALSSLAQAEESFGSWVESELRASRECLHRLAQAPRFQEAVLLSNPAVIEAGMPSYLRSYDPERRPSRIKYFERQLCAYLQRFCAKNDTASFFGPIDYGQCGPASSASFRLERRPEEPNLRRLTRLSYWASQLLADQIAANVDVAPFLAPRLHSGCAVLASGEILVAPRNERISLPAWAAGALRAIDGRSTVEQLEQRLGSNLRNALELLRARGLVCLDLRIPTAEFDPLAWVRRWVESLPETCPARSTWSERLARLAQDVSRFAASTGREQLEALKELETSFAALTGAKPRRREGEAYADRLLVYDEAQGDVVACELGSALAADIVRRLGPALDLAASYSELVQSVCRERALEVFAAMGGNPVPYLAFVQRLDRALELEDCLSAPSVVEYIEGLRALVRSRVGEGGVARLTASELAAFVRPMAPGTLVSPDCFVMAADPEAIRRGEFELLLGEIHHGAQVLSHFLTFFDRRRDLERAFEELLSTRRGDCERADVVYARSQGKVFNLELPGLSVEVRGRSNKPSACIVPAAELEVHREPGGLALRFGARRIELYAGDPRAVSNWIFGPAPVIPPPVELGRQTPRVEIEGVVYQRARWRVDGAEWSAAPAGVPELVLRAARLQIQRGIPERCFARVASERKPFFVDFTSAFSLEYFATSMRGGSGATLTELLPAEGGLWLHGAEGARTCEWRMTLVRGPRP